MVSEIRNLAVAAGVFGSLAATTLVTIAVINGFKDSGQVDNTTAAAFVTGVAIFGTFSSVISLGILGKVIIRMFQSA